MADEFVARKGLRALQDSNVTGSLDVSQNLTVFGTISGSISVIYSNVLDKPTLVSASAQIDHDATTNYTSSYLMLRLLLQTG